MTSIPGAVCAVRCRRGVRVRAEAARLSILILIPFVSALTPADSFAQRRLGGLLALDAVASARWPACGTWIAPVGDSCAGSRGEAPYRVNRGLEWSDTGALTHRGVDLCNRRAGGSVLAAAHGVVVHADDPGRGGYGVLVVLAHRLENSSFAYSVYAHLAPGSLRVQPGATVAAGQLLGKVGRSGNASTDHLHFEVRRPRDLSERWEHGAALDPMAFLAERRSCRSDDTTWARPYLEWAERSALVEPGSPGHERLTRHRWWRMLASSAERALDSPEQASASRAALIDEGVLSENEPGSNDPIGWPEATVALERLARRGLRVPPFGTGPGHRRICEARFQIAHPAHRIDRLVTNPSSPTIADACLLIADLSALDEGTALGAESPRKP